MERIANRTMTNTGAKVVHCDANANQLKAAQDREAASEVLDQHTLGDFEFQSGWRKTGFQQHRMNQSRKATVPELDCRYINPDLECIRPFPPSPPGLPPPPLPS